MIAPSNDFEACFTQIMKRQSPKLDLVAAGYNGRFVRSHQGADFFLSSPFVDHQGCRAPLIGDDTRPDQAIERPRVWSQNGNWKPELKRDLTGKPSSDLFWRARQNVGLHSSVEIASVVCYSRLHIAGGAHLLRDVW